MTIASVQSNYEYGGYGATPAITPTSATTLGNFLFVEISYDTFGGTQTGWTPPTGWIGITPVNVGGKNADGNVACFYYPNAPAISTAQTFTPVGTSVVLNANIVTFQEFSGVPTNATLDTVDFSSHKFFSSPIVLCSAVADGVWGRS